MEKGLYLTLLLLISNLCIGQNIVEGSVTDSLGNPVNHAQVILYSAADSAIITFAFVDGRGHYSMTISRKGKYRIEFRALGFASYDELLTFEGDSSVSIRVNPILKESHYDISEVIKYGDKPITIKKDTVVYNVKSFINGSEQVVEDVLKKLPGIDVDDAGKVTYHGKEVEKVMVEDNDFFGKGYRMITKNVHANAIEKVEAISNYSENPLLKKFASTEKVALNLKLNQSSYKKIYGSLNLGYNTINDHNINTSLMNFNKRVSSLILGNTNSLGYNPVGSSYELSDALATTSEEEVNDFDFPDFMIKFDEYRPLLKRQQVNELKSEMVSVNEAFKISPKTKLTITSIYNKLNDLFLLSKYQMYSFDTISFTNIEEYRYNQTDRSTIVKAKLDSRIKSNSFLQYSLMFSTIKRSNFTTTNFNQLKIDEQLPGRQYLLKTNLAYTIKISNRSLAQLKVFGYKGAIDDEYVLSPLPPNSISINWTLNNKGAQGVSNDSYMLLGIIGFKHKIDDILLLNAEVGGIKSQNNINSNFYVFDPNQSASVDYYFSGLTRYSSNKLFSKANVVFGTDNLNLNAGVVGEIISCVEGISGFKTSKHFILPQLEFKWLFNKLNTVKLFYSSKATPLSYNQVVNNYLLIRNNYVYKGHFPKVLSSRYIGGSYSLGKMNTRFFLNSSLMYVYEPEFIGRNSLLSPNLIISIDTVAKNRTSFMSNIELNYFIKLLRTNVKFTYLNYTYEYINFLYGQTQRNKSVSTSTGIELRSSFYSFLNFHLGYSITQGRMVSNKSKKSFYDRLFCNLYLKPNDRISFEMLGELYGNQNSRINFSSNSYLFVSSRFTYNFSKSGWSFSIDGFNLFDKRLYHLDLVSEYYYSTTSYYLVPRYLMATVSFRF